MQEHVNYEETQVHTTSNTPNAQKSCLLTASVGVFFNLLLSTFMVTNFYSIPTENTSNDEREALSNEQ